MRRRLTLAMVLMVFGALLLSGAVSLAVAVRDARDQTRHELVHEAKGLAVTVPTQVTTRANPAAALKTLLGALTRPMRLEGATVVALRLNGTLFDPVTPRTHVQLPSGLTRSELNPQALLAGQTVSGQRGSLVWAAAPFTAQLLVLGASRTVTQAVVLTSKPPNGLSEAGTWFALSSLVILAVAILVAYRLGVRFVRPLRATEAVTRRIAGGDLDARVPDPPGADPELGALVSSVNSMADSLARARRSEQEFLQSVSHDLRTPLTSIRGFAEALEDGTAPDVPRAAGVIASEARRLERLVADLLSLATARSRRFTLNLQEVDLAASVRATASSFGPAAAGLGISLLVDDAPGPITVLADPDRLAQVTANLVENALRFAHHEVRVHAAGGPGRPEVWVTDDGAGIPEGDLPHVFDRYFTAGDRPGRPASTGLGLAIVSELVAAMGGTVRAESPAGPSGGTRMVVSMPAAHRAPPLVPARS